MNNTPDRLSQWIYYLASSLYFGAVLLRSIILYREDPGLAMVLSLLLAGLLLFISEPFLSRRWAFYFPIYLALQTGLVFVLLRMPGYTDFYAALLPILSMQIMLRLSPKFGAAWIALCAVLLVPSLAGMYGIPQSIALSLIYTAGNVFLGTYTLAMRRAQQARTRNQVLARELETANRQLETYASQLEQLAVTQERNRLARELHDSVTQTVFSMTLTTQSALLTLERDPPGVGSHLERLNQLAGSALSEMQLLISELKPEMAGRAGLVASLKRHLAGSRYPREFSVSISVEGDQALQPAEEQGLFHIAEEAFNNIVKHAQTSQAQLRLHLSEPFWMEIEDQGKGFDLHDGRSGEQVGLSSMQERAGEMGWELKIKTSPGAGTCIRVEKKPVSEGRV